MRLAGNQPWPVFLLPNGVNVPDMGEMVNISTDDRKIDERDRYQLALRR